MHSDSAAEHRPHSQDSLGPRTLNPKTLNPKPPSVGLGLLGQACLGRGVQDSSLPRGSIYIYIYIDILTTVIIRSPKDHPPHGLWDLTPQS